MTHHPASTIDAEKAAKAFAASLTGRGPHWDETMAVMHPKMANSGNENAWYVIDNCIDEGICESEPEPGSDEEFEILTRWCEKRAQTCKQKMHQVAIENGHILAHRIIDSEPENLKASLGIFWSHDFGNWPDPVTPWGKGRGAFPTLLIEALVPVEAVDWQISCTALMDWMVGDCESELRLKPGYPLKEVRGFYLSDRKPIILPDKEYAS